ncbi:hypothetical protein KSS87_004724 [Heliosperma pusillum]|nr:hypothetical protein KSS87_004724 [Heliosperma pusillum]
MTGGGAPAKASEPSPHPPKDQLPNVSYCITSPPPWRESLSFVTASLVCDGPEAILLGFQHYIVMLGTTVLIPSALVPQMGGGKIQKAEVIQTLLFVAGLNTLLQSTFGTRLPAVIGGSYTFVAPTISIILAGRYSNIEDPILKFHKIMRAIQGAMIVASTLQIVLGFSGLWRNVTRFLSPLSVVPLISMVGFGLYELGFPGVAKCVEIGLPELVILIFVAVYLSQATKFGKHVFERFAVLFSVAIVWLYAHILTVGGAYNHAAPRTQSTCRTDRSGLISGAPWIKVPYPFQWGAPTFDAGEAFAMMFASFVALVESTGAFIAVSRSASATMMPPSVLSRGVGWQLNGFKVLSMFNVNIGPVEVWLSQVQVRLSEFDTGLRLSFLIQITFTGWVIEVGSVGLSFLQFCNLNSFRTKFILGFSIFLGLSIPQYFNEYEAINKYGPVHTRATWFNDMVNVPFSSEAFVAGLVAYFLDNTLHRKDGSVRKDRGKHWWDKFRSYKGDSRSEEFYSLPLNLNKYFPSV